MKRSVNGACLADEDSYCMDEFAIVINGKKVQSYNIKGSESNQVKELQYRNKFVKDWDVRVPTPSVINREMKW